MTLICVCILGKSDFFPKKRDWQKKHIAVELDLLDDIIDGNV